MPIRYFLPVGGPAHPVNMSDERDMYMNRDSALVEWKKRRNGLSTQYSHWGCNPVDNSPNILAVIEVEYSSNPVLSLLIPTRVRNSWTARELIPQDEMFHYYDEIDIARSTC